MSSSHSSQLNRAFYFITVIFFAWGFITCLNDILAPHLKDYFQLSYTKSMLLQFCFFATYAVMSLPMSHVLNYLGYQKTMIVGLLLAGLGCMIFWPAAQLSLYPLFLFGMFVLASGIVALQVAANPYVTLLGQTALASSRLTFAQAVNSLGYTIAPFLLGGLIIAGSVVTAYLVLALALVILALIIRCYPLPAFTHRAAAVEDSITTEPRSVWREPAIVFGAIAIFMYVGAEVSAGTLVVNYLNLPHIANLPKAIGTHYLSIYWGGALVGRFIGTWILAKVRPARVVAIAALINVALLLLAVFAEGEPAMIAMLSLGLFNSVMFPTIFALTVSRVPQLQKQASGLLCAAIVGGAVIPELQGMLADAIGLQLSYLLLLSSYGFIAIYALFFYRTH